MTFGLACECARCEGIEARWQFGRWMLTHVPEGRKKLPDGFLERLCEATGKSEPELKNRAQLAREHPTAEALATAVANHPSWTELRDSLGSRTAHVSHNSGDNEWYTPALLSWFLAPSPRGWAGPRALGSPRTGRDEQRPQGRGDDAGVFPPAASG